MQSVVLVLRAIQKYCPFACEGDLPITAETFVLRTESFYLLFQTLAE
jgi:hypothetical protein